MGAFSLVAGDEGTEPNTVPKSGRTALALLVLHDDFDFPSVAELPLPPLQPFRPTLLPRLDETTLCTSLLELFTSASSLSDGEINVSKPNFSTVSTKRIPDNACAINQSLSYHYARCSMETKTLLFFSRYKNVFLCKACTSRSYLI